MLGVMPRMARDPLRLLREVAEHHGDVAYLGWTPSQRFYLINHPEDVQRVLQEHSRNYRRGPQTKPLTVLFGSGLPTLDGETWRQRRRLLQPEFHRQRLAAMVERMTGTIAERLEHWPTLAESAGPVDIHQEMALLTMRVIARTMFSSDVGDGLAEEMEGALVLVLDHIYERRFHLLGALKHWLPLPENHRYRRALRGLHRTVDRIIEARRRSSRAYDDLLAMLMAARDAETGEALSAEELHDEILTIFVGGYETSADALAWSWYLLGQAPHAYEALQREATVVLGGRAPRFADLGELRYARMVFSEALRLYPPAWLNARTCMEGDELRGYRIPAGACVFISPYVLHRHPGFWPEPDRFDPERFTEERSKDRPRYAYIPFGGGPHLCIGKEFALMEGLFILAMVAQSWRLELVPGHPVEPVPAITLRPKHGVPMRLHRRGASPG